ncbi:MAG: hypothetical protein JWO96_713 [Candidatus Saccharibacteria bacterium]|nr:hypothetical protein [Candidatus Saccharibacteria bacterium]
MASAGYGVFDTTLSKTNRVLKEIEDTYGWPRERRQQSYDALRAVLHAMRDRLTVFEASDLAAQLPMLIRGIYYEGWNPAKVPVRMHLEDFLNRVRQEFPYRVEGDTEELVRVVLDSLSDYITEGELEDIKSNMPKDLAAILP